MLNKTLVLLALLFATMQVQAQSFMWDDDDEAIDHLIQTQDQFDNGYAAQFRRMQNNLTGAISDLAEHSGNTWTNMWNRVDIGSDALFNHSDNLNGIIDSTFGEVNNGLNDMWNNDSNSAWGSQSIWNRGSGASTGSNRGSAAR